VFANTGTYSSSTPIDPTPASSSVTIDVTMPDLGILKTVDDDTPNAGGTITFTLKATNSGNVALTGVTLSDILPTQIASFTTSGSGMFTGGVWTVGDLAVGQMKSIDIIAVLKTGIEGETFTNTVAYISSTPPVPTTTPSSVQVEVSSPNIDVSKTASPVNPVVGGLVSWSIKVSHFKDDTGFPLFEEDSTVGVSGLVVTDELQSGLAFVTTGSTCTLSGLTDITCSYSGLELGEEKTRVYFTTVLGGTEGTTIENTAVYSTSVPVDPTADADMAFIDVASPNVDILKTVDNAFPNAGDTITFTLKATNTNIGLTGTDLTGLTFSDILPTQVASFTTSGSGMFTGGVWTVGDLAKGAMKSIDIIAVLKTGIEGETFTNTVTYLSSTPTDPTPASSSIGVIGRWHRQGS